MNQKKYVDILRIKASYSETMEHVRHILAERERIN